MCGIMGYCGEERAAEKIFSGLLRLEYRGYDSAGVATVRGEKLYLAKKKGRVAELKGYIGGLEGNTGIGHTRWATHGKPSDINAHPHISGGFALVHNGIVENFAELKEGLLSRGASFVSETDSEVILKLVEENFSGDLLSAVKKSVDMIKGSYALMVMRAGVQQIVVARSKSPVVLGRGKSGNFISSDCPALAGECDEICVLEEGDFAVVDCKSVHIFDKNLKICERDFVKNQAESESFSLCGYAHFMQKEIFEAPRAVNDTVRAFSGCAEGLKAALSRAERVVLLGCGTAYHAALCGKRFFEGLCRIPAEAQIAGEYRYSDPIVGKNCLIFAVSQSGETADTLEAARLARSLGATVVAVTNSPHSQLARLAALSLPVVAGAEICVAATKSFSAQVASLYLAARLRAGTYGDLCVQEVLKTSEICGEILKNEHISRTLDGVACLCAEADGAYFLGRDIDYALALEGSLKMKETSYIRCEGYPAGELKHGSLALIDERAVCVLICTREQLADKCKNAVGQITSRGGKAVVISPYICGDGGEIRVTFPVSPLPCLAAAGILQLLAYKTAVLLNRDPDKPRNLAKSVTVE